MKTLFTILLFVPFLLKAQRTDVIWQHGLHDKYAGKFGFYIAEHYEAERQMWAYAPRYLNVSTKYHGVPRFAREIDNYMRPLIRDMNGSIFIGHSMGGLAGQWLVNNGTHFRGIVTVGSLINGAKIVNSMRPWWGWVGPSNASLFFQNTLYQSTRGFTAIAYSSIIFAPIGLIWDAVYKATGLANFLVGGAIIPEITDIEVNSNTMNDLSEGSSYIHTQRNTPTNIPRIALWGEASVPIIDMWAKDKGFDRTLNTLRDLNFGGFQVARWVPVVGEWPARECLQAFFYLRDQISGNFMNLITNDVRWERRTERYLQGFRMESCFRDRVTQTRNECRGWGWLQWVCFPFVYIFEVFKCIFVDTFREVEHVYYAPTYEPSDGIVSRSTQRGDGSTWMNGGTTYKIRQPINHLEMGGPKSYSTFDAVFDGRVLPNIPNPNQQQRDESPFRIFR